MNVKPYNNDFNVDKEYYELLFKPSVAVQVRELNALQTQIQTQIERFGDNIFKSGTIVSGCNFSFYPTYNFVKLLDNDTSGATIDPSLFVNLFVLNSDNLQAYVTNFQEGFESTDPNLKTIFVNYINSGDSGNTAFSAGDILTVIDGKNSIFSITVTNGGQNFANTDTLVFSPILEVNTSSGTFAINDYISDGVYGSNAQISNITTISGSNNVLLTVTPLTTDLTNAASNSNSWTFGAQDSIQNSGNTAVGVIVKVYGSGASGRIVTDGVGKIVSAFMVDRGQNYSIVPYVTVKSANNSTGLSTLNLTAVNYFTQIKVASVANPVGNGYAFGVSEGTIYQVGHFLKVDDQIIIVNAYSSTPNNVSAGFDTQESIINYTIDSSLTDNALGTENDNAPGADRLKLHPILTVVNTDIAEGNTEFMSLVNWNDGNPFQQTQLSVYSKIGDEMANRMNDASGDFVLDPFLVTTASIANQSSEGALYTAVVDPGTAYISGYKTSTLRNFKIDVPKGTSTLVSNAVSVSLNYDNFLRINEVGGLFQFSTGDTISFYDTAKQFLSNTSLAIAGNTTPQGNLLGTARIRSLVLENGVAGDSSAIYRIYLFNVQMNTGANFRNVRSIYYNGTNKGIADVILQLDATTAVNIAAIQDSKSDQLVFPTNVVSIRNTNNTIYVYRTIDQTTTTANTGLLTKSIASNPNESYPYSSILSFSDLRDLYVVPIGNNLIGYTPLSGTVAVTTTSPNAVGTSTTFITDLAAGDYVRVGNTTANQIKKVKTVVNNTLVVLDSNCSFANTAASYNRAFPQNVPIPLGTRAGITANLNANGNVLTVNFGMTMEGTTSVNTALGVSIRRSGATSTSKTTNRLQFVKLQLSNNAGGVSGPWCLGVPDAFRLRNVYVGNSSVNTSSIDIGSEFYIDHNQTPDYLDLSYLYSNPKSSISLLSSNYLLVCFDYFSRSDDGYFDTVSYLGTSNATQIAALDSLPLANLSTAAASFEVPEFYDPNGNYYDLLNCLDFRPAVVNTVAVTACSATAPLNPPYSLSFGNTSDPTNDKKFPLPDSTCVTTIEQYMGRTDVAVVGSDGNIVVQQGSPDADPTKQYPPTVSSDSLILNRIRVPPYPNISVNLSNNVLQLIDTSTHTSGRTGTRLATHTIVPLVSNSQTSVPTQPQGYTMAQIGALERRIQNLEYYTSLSILETSITNKIIPSSIDPSLNRFKFGFTADDFSTVLYSDKTNPQYAAEIEVADNTVDTTNTVPQLASNLCVPPKFRWTLGHSIDLNLPYIDFPIVKQSVATVSPDVVQPGCIPVSINVNTLVQVNALSFASQQLGPAHSTYHGPAITTLYTKFSSLSGNATCFFSFAYDPLLTIYQSQNADYSNAVKVIDTASSVALTDADVNFLLTDPSDSSFWIPCNSLGADYKGHDTGKIKTNHLQHHSGGDIAGSGKIEFVHNPANGRYYFIIISTVDSYWGYHTMFRYPVDQGSNSTTIDPCGKIGAAGGYSGIARANYSEGNSIVPDGVTQFNQVEIQCTGMLPGTQHDLYVNGILNSINARPYGGTWGDGIFSDATGKISCYFNLATSNWASVEQELGLTATPTTSALILNQGQTFSNGFIGDAYNLFEVLAPNSRAGTTLAYVPWTSF